MRASCRSNFAVVLILLCCSLDAAGDSFDGDTFSFHHQTGALIDGIFKCFSEHTSGMDDNTVVFDGFTELLDPYTDGNQPFIFEFETSRRTSVQGGDTFGIEMFTMGNSDLFPEGFEDPETGTPLTDACIEIGIDDTLDSDVPVDVTSASLTLLMGTEPALSVPIAPSFFDKPWDGRMSLVVPSFAGLDVDGVQLQLQLLVNPQPIFSDGFESGNTAAWTDEVP